MFQIFLLLCEAVIFLEPKGTLALMNMNREEKSYSDANLISVFLENVLNLGVKSLRDKEISTELTSRSIVRRCDKSVLQSLIQNKVKELRPMLQDEDYNEVDPEDNLTLQSEDETTIVELVTEGKGSLRKKESFKHSIKKYKRLKRMIHKALINESVSNKTVHLIIRTIDDMIAKMIASRCSWKRNVGEGNVFRITDGDGENIFGLPAAWNSEWQKIKEKYSDLFRNNKSIPQNELNVVIKSLMEKLPSFFANILKDGELLSKEYNVRCQKIRKSDLLDTEAGRRDNFLINDSRRHNAFCKTKIWMCSGELKHFLTYVYKSIHLTTAKILTDYLEMYKRDVNINKIYGSKSVVTRLKEVNQEASNEVCTIYVTEIGDLHMEREKETQTYVMALLYLINNITEKIIIRTNEINRFKMRPIDGELKGRILKDIDSNMRVELERLSDELKKSVCSAFQTCNGRYTVRNYKRSRDDFNSVFVQVIVKLDDEAKISKRTHSFRPNESNRTATKTTEQIQNTNLKLRKHNKKAFSVTRTSTNCAHTSNVMEAA